MRNLSSHITDPRKTPQSKPIPGRESEMVKNAAGGFVFRAGDWERLSRFLIIGSEGGTYYAGEKELTLDNVDVVLRCLSDDPLRVLARAVEVSDQGLAPKNDPAILVLALAFCVRETGKPGGGGPSFGKVRAKALQDICRTGTHLFQFLEAVRTLRGGGRSLNGAVRAWIDAKPTDELAFQMVKYRNRAGWTWRDVFRRYRPKPPADTSEVHLPGVAMHGATDVAVVARRALYKWVARKAGDVGETLDVGNLPRAVRAYERVNHTPPEQLASVILEERVPWEFVPSEHTTRADVLEALFESMPLMATVRQLPKLTAHGVLPKRRDDAIARLTNPEAIARSRIHPVALLVAAAAYEIGSNRNLKWTPDARIVDALDDAFHLALKTAAPTGERLLVCIDTSGSMRGPSSCHGLPLFKIAAAMALTYVHTDQADVMCFDVGAEALPLSPRQRTVDAVRAIDALRRGGSTDCSLPFSYAMERSLAVDTFVVLTDNETWAGKQHPTQALARYRATVNSRARVVWCAMTAEPGSCGDPSDPLSLSISGFDASAPSIVSNFAAGRF